MTSLFDQVYRYRTLHYKQPYVIFQIELLTHHLVPVFYFFYLSYFFRFCPHTEIQQFAKSRTKQGKTQWPKQCEG